MQCTKLKVAAIGAVLAVATGCGTMSRVTGGGATQTYALMPAENTPAATGIVKIGETDDMNKELNIKVQHLPRPAELDPSLTTYMVWIDAGKGRDPIPVGQLQINKDREASAKFATPFSTFDLMVTAEPSATPSEPSNFVVLQGRVYSTPAS